MYVKAANSCAFGLAAASNFATLQWGAILSQMPTASVVLHECLHRAQFHAGQHRGGSPTDALLPSRLRADHHDSTGKGTGGMREGRGGGMTLQGVVPGTR